MLRSDFIFSNLLTHSTEGQKYRTHQKIDLNRVAGDDVRPVISNGYCGRKIIRVKYKPAIFQDVGENFSVAYIPIKICTTVFVNYFFCIAVI